jgi:hypothetical protein
MFLLLQGPGPWDRHLEHCQSLCKGRTLVENDHISPTATPLTRNSPRTLPVQERGGGGKLDIGT